MNQTVITIGHSVYHGANALRMCFSKAQAVRVLQARGVKRDDARAAVSKVCQQPNGYTCVRADYDPIEVRNAQHDFDMGYMMASVPDMRKYWAKQPEA